MNNGNERIVLPRQFHELWHECKYTQTSLAAHFSNNIRADIFAHGSVCAGTKEARECSPRKA